MRYLVYRFLILALLISLFAFGQACAIGLAIGADASGGVYVLDGTSSTLLKFDESGKQTAKWTPKPKDDYFSVHAVLGVGRDGHAYLGNFGDRVVLDLGTGLKSAKGWPVKDFGPGPYGLAVDGKGNVYVLGYSVVKLSPAGQSLARWQDGDHRFEIPRSIAVDAEGNTYVGIGTGSVCETEDGKETERDVDAHITKLDPTGKRIGLWESDDKNGGRFLSPSGIAFDSAGNMYVTDSQYSTVQKFDKTGKRVLEWKLKGLVATPKGIAVGPKDRIYVVEAFNSRVLVFDSSGKELTSWPLPEAKSAN